MTNLLTNPGFEELPDTTNQIVNPEFETDADHWLDFYHTTSIARTTSQHQSGVASLSVVGDGANGGLTPDVNTPSDWCGVFYDNGYVPVVAGRTYIFSYYAKTTGGSGDSFQACFVDYYDTGQNYLSSFGAFSGTTGGTVGVWTKYDFYITPPATAAYITITIGLLRQTNSSQFYVDTIDFHEHVTGAGNGLESVTGSLYINQTTGAAHTGTYGLATSVVTTVLERFQVSVSAQHYAFTGFARSGETDAPLTVTFHYYKTDLSTNGTQTETLGTIGATATPSGIWLSFAVTARVPLDTVYVQAVFAGPGSYFLDVLSFKIGGTAGGTNQSEVPFLTSNDRYQVVLCSRAGTNSTTPTFRYWHAGPPLWGSTLAEDPSLPIYHTLDEDGNYLGGEIELPFQELSRRRGGLDTEAQIRGILVEFIPRPSVIDENIDDDYSIGFSGRVEAMTVPNYARTVNLTTFSGVAVSDDFAFTSTVGVQASDTWPNIRTAYLPVRLDQKVRAARVILTDVHLVEIVSVQLVGDSLSSRTT